MKHILFCLGLFFSLFGNGHAQSPDQTKRSEEIVAKMRQIDILNQVIPLALTKDQINKLLPAVERARAKVIQTQKDEAVTLEKLDGKITAAIKKSIQDGLTPPRDLLDELA